MTSPPYISSADLSELMKSEKVPMKDYVGYPLLGPCYICKATIDVRDDDFIGGNIVGCIRAPSLKFLETVDDLISMTKGIPVVVFHCTLSQLRGPKAAKTYAEGRARVLGPDKASIQGIYVLHGGFTEF